MTVKFQYIKTLLPRIRHDLLPLQNLQLLAKESSNYLSNFPFKLRKSQGVLRAWEKALDSLSPQLLLKNKILLTWNISEDVTTPILQIGKQRHRWRNHLPNITKCREEHCFWFPILVLKAKKRKTLQKENKLPLWVIRDLGRKYTLSHEETGRQKEEHIKSRLNYYLMLFSPSKGRQ